jgi:hypothetical protein
MTTTLLHRLDLARRNGVQPAITAAPGIGRLLGAAAMLPWYFLRHAARADRP